jgi:hypothetical protein
LFGGVFIYAGVLKALDPGLFLLDVRSFALLPDPYAAWLALFLPWLEIFTGLAVITGVLRNGGLLLLNGSLLVFLAALGIAWSRGTQISCGCFGGDSASTADNYIWYVSRDVALLALGLFLLYRSLRQKTPTS